MSWNLGNPGLLPWLLLGLVPLLLHLLARLRPPVYRFSSLAFLRRIVRHRLRVRRPQEWLLLALRTLAMLALALLFLQPVLFTRRELGSLEGRRNVVLVVDATASMQWVDGGQTRFSQAVAEASEVLGSLRSGDTANVIWLQHVPEAVFPDPGANLAALLAELRRRTCTLQAGDIPAALALARAQLDGVEGAREICIVSDFQASTWRGVDLGGGVDEAVVLVRVGTTDGENCAVAGLRAVPSRPLRGEVVEFHCEIRGFSAQAQHRTVTFAAGEARQSQDVKVPAWGTATAVFRQKLDAAGEIPVQAAIGEDGFPADDTYWHLLTVREQIDVGLVGKNRHTTEIWMRCLRALGWVRVVHLGSAAAAAGEDLQGLVVTDWDGSAMEDLLAQAAEHGTVVLVEPWRRALAPGCSPPSNASAAWEVPAEPMGLQVVQPEHGVLRVFTEGDYGSPAAGLLRGRQRWSEDGGWVPLLAYADRQPAIAAAAGQPLCWLWNIALEPEFGTYAAQPQFLVLVGELLQLGRARAAVGVRPAVCGERLVLHTDAAVSPADVRLACGAGAPAAIEPRPTAAGGLLSHPTAAPGLYGWTADGRLLGRNVVAFPAAESDLRGLPKGGLSGAAAAVEGGAALRHLRRGRALWPLLLLACLTALLAEGLALRWMDRSSTR